MHQPRIYLEFAGEISSHLVSTRPALKAACTN